MKNTRNFFIDYAFFTCFAERQSKEQPLNVRYSKKFFKYFHIQNITI